MAATPEKWELIAWPATGPISTTEALWSRSYVREPSAYRAVPQIHRRFPEARLEVVHFVHYVLKGDGAYWVSVDAPDRLEFCPGCGRMLNCSMGDIWHCPGCGDEWDPDTTTAWRAS